MSDYFKDIPTIKYEGRDSTNPLSFKFYDANKKILGKTLEEHLRMAVCYWHTFNWPGGDPFGGQTFLRPWMEAGDKIEQAKDKSLFRYEEYDSRAREVTSGYEDNYWLSPEITGTMQEWIKAYKRFCNKKVNIYGKKVDRTRLLNDKFATNKFSKKCQD